MKESQYAEVVTEITVVQQQVPQVLEFPSTLEVPRMPPTHYQSDELIKWNTYLQTKRTAYRRPNT